MYHFIVAFDWKESAKIISAGYLSTIAYEICEHFESEYQIVFAEHHKLDDHLSGKKGTLAYPFCDESGKLPNRFTLSAETKK